MDASDTAARCADTADQIVAAARGAIVPGLTDRHGRGMPPYVTTLLWELCRLRVAADGWWLSAAQICALDLDEAVAHALAAAFVAIGRDPRGAVEEVRWQRAGARWTPRRGDADLAH